MAILGHLASNSLQKSCRFFPCPSVRYDCWRGHWVFRFDQTLEYNHIGGDVLRTEVGNAGINFTTPARSDLCGPGGCHCAVVVSNVSQSQGYIDGQLANGIKRFVLDADSYGPEFVNYSDPIKGEVEDWA